MTIVKVQMMFPEIAAATLLTDTEDLVYGELHSFMPAEIPGCGV